MELNKLPFSQEIKFIAQLNQIKQSINSLPKWMNCLFDWFNGMNWDFRLNDGSLDYYNSTASAAMRQEVKMKAELQWRHGWNGFIYFWLINSTANFMNEFINQLLTSAIYFWMNYEIRLNDCQKLKPIPPRQFVCCLVWFAELIAISSISLNLIQFPALNSIWMKIEWNWAIKSNQPAATNFRQHHSIKPLN